LDLSTDQIFLNTVDVCATDINTKQKILLTCPLSKRLAFWGVRMMPPAHSPEVISMAMAGIVISNPINLYLTFDYYSLLLGPY